MKFSQALHVAWNLVALYRATSSALKGLVPLLPALRPVSTDPQVQFNLCLGSLQPALLTYGQLAQKPGTSAEVEERPFRLPTCACSPPSKFCSENQRFANVKFCAEIPLAHSVTYEIHILRNKYEGLSPSPLWTERFMELSGLW